MASKPDGPSKDEDAGIQVYLRVRPSPSPSTHFKRDDIDLNIVRVSVPKNSEDVVNNSRSGYTFGFSGVLDEKVTQRDVFRSVGVPAVRNALAGYNCTIFAYGQTGSGKTFTITGGPERYDDRGIIPRAISHLFRATKGEEANGASYTCYVSYLEIYNQSGYDLLTEGIDRGGGATDEVPKVTMLEDENGHFHFKNLSMHSVSSEEDALNLLFLGETNRAIAATEMNQNSTRRCVKSVCCRVLFLFRRLQHISHRVVLVDPVTVYLPSSWRKEWQVPTQSREANWYVPPCRLCCAFALNVTL